MSQSPRQEIDRNRESRYWDDAALVLEFLEASAEERRQIAARLQQSLARPRSRELWTRIEIPSPRPGGEYVLLPGPWAAWLVSLLTASPDEVETTRLRLVSSLQQGTESSAQQGSSE